MLWALTPGFLSLCRCWDSLKPRGSSVSPALTPCSQLNQPSRLHGDMACSNRISCKAGSQWFLTGDSWGRLFSFCSALMQQNQSFGAGWHEAVGAVSPCGSRQLRHPQDPALYFHKVIYPLMYSIYPSFRREGYLWNTDPPHKSSRAKEAHSWGGKKEDTGVRVRAVTHLPQQPEMLS